MSTTDAEMLTEHSRPISKSEYFDHVNDCEVTELNWIDGDAYCPECGEHGVVYQRKAWFATKPTEQG